jgi:gamma-butyrobetaine dioxygenase
MRIERSGLHELALRDDCGRMTPLHPLWLRERCGSSESQDERTGQRLYDPSDLPADLAIVAIAESHSGWEVTFSDGHRSQVDAATLLAEASWQPHADGLPPAQPWDSTLNTMPRFDWHGSDTQTVLSAFLRFGFVILANVPTTPGSVLTAARRFGFVRDTNFGALFDVRSVPEATDLAYTGLSLDPHTDNPYRAPVPGIQLLHCLANETTGGHSTLVDSLRVLEMLRRQDAEAFAILAETPVRFVYRDAQTELVHFAPMIALDASGRIEGMRFSPRLDYVPFMEPARLDHFYRARRLVDGLLRSPSYELRFMLADGDLLMFDNQRLLHGRSAFDPQEGLRHLQGCYIDMDGVRSLYRVLNRARVDGARN